MHKEDASEEQKLSFLEKVIAKFISHKEQRQIVKIQKAFLKSWANKDPRVNDREWLREEFRQWLPDYSNEEIEEMASEIESSLALTESKQRELTQALERGQSIKSWLASDLQNSTAQLGEAEQRKTLEEIHWAMEQNQQAYFEEYEENDALKNTASQQVNQKFAGDYLQNLDKNIDIANKEMLDTITTKSGGVNLNPNLDGLIAEQHHTNTFNASSTARGSDLRATVLHSNQADSVDVVIKNSQGQIVDKYQMKYYKDAKSTINAIKAGDYSDQVLVVPTEQLDEVKKAFPDRKVTDRIGNNTIKSQPVTKVEMKEQQGKAQKAFSLETDWSSYSNKDLAMGIGKTAGIASLAGAGVATAAHIASKLWNDEEVETEKLVEEAITSGLDTGVKTATAGALKVASEKGLIKHLSKGTPGVVFANIAYVAVENIKIMSDPKLTVSEKLDKMGQTTTSAIAGISGAAKGAAIGASIGAVGGPVGSFVGGFVGSVVGSVAGSKVGKAVYEGAKVVHKEANKVVTTMVNAAVDVSKAAVNAVGNVAKKAWDAFTGLFA